VQDEVGFFENKLRVTLAGRYTTLKTGDVYNGDYKNSKFTPRVGVSYSINKNTALYFVNDQSFMENYGSDWQGKSFDPISGANLEFGIKRDWLNGKWNSAVSVYQITRNNVLTADLAHPILDTANQPTGQFYNRQSGQQKTKGVEVDIRGQVAKGLDVIINYAFTEAKVTKDSDEKNVGIQVPGSSRHVQNTWLNYKIDKGNLTGLGFSVGYQFQAKRSPWYVFDGSANSLPDYFRLDGGVSYQRNKIGFNLLVNNILNKYLYSGSPYSWGGYYYWQAEPGTNVRLSVNYKF
jgi:iron complex outermembrane recepter protein